MQVEIWNDELASSIEGVNALLDALQKRKVKWRERREKLDIVMNFSKGEVERPRIQVCQDSRVGQNAARLGIQRGCSRQARRTVQ